ncbi:methionine gamma-lyase [Gallaecimonas kandeliae]|uniref:methionine gamma-lyase n=1 Tax=Gallaecimonas kandeliae TaxID=3029055 RepID=UPI002647F462|nr:methionine gamma-lyase [Gallaecimonas kandeliae]WKE64120.1 methionine gamma-lyase [Gallaecimonas kandeliae]
MSQWTHPETAAIHGGKDHSDPQRALATPLYQTSTFAFENTAQGAARFAGEDEGPIYSRLGNPTVAELERRVAALEGMEAAVATASGMAAVSAALLGVLKSGDHLVASKAVYGCSFALMNHMLPRFGIEVSFVDMTKPEEVADAIRDNTKALFLETPVNPNLEVIDLEAIGALVKRHGLIGIADNTFLTPLLQKPVQYGFELVLHSATKYLNGHGDVIAGILCGSSERIAEIRGTAIKDIGGVLGPFEAWLILRGLKTLPVRMERHCQSALKVAQWLEAHPKVKAVYYPGLESHPGYRFLGGQMLGAGGVIAFELEAGLQASANFIDRLELFTLAVSLGDAESLISHPASMTHSPYSAEERAMAGISDSLIRVSIGLEHVEDLVADLAASLDKL